jgi:hypothetical protein
MFWHEETFMRAASMGVIGLVLFGLAADEARAQRIELQPFVGIRCGGGFEVEFTGGATFRF